MFISTRQHDQRVRAVVVVLVRDGNTGRGISVCVLLDAKGEWSLGTRTSKYGVRLATRCCVENTLELGGTTRLVGDSRALSPSTVALRTQGS